MLIIVERLLMKKLLKDIKASRRIFKDMGMKKWHKVKMSDIRKGDRIRIYSNAGCQLEIEGEETLIAKSDACQMEGVWTIEI